MTRRELVRLATLIGFSIPMAKFDALKAQEASSVAPAELRIPLDQWAGLTFEYRGKKITVTSADIFNAVRKGITQ